MSVRAVLRQRTQDDVRDPEVRPWRAGEYARTLEPLVHRIVPTVLSKRNYHLPALNRVGLSAVEFLVTALILAAVSAHGFGQLNNGERDDSGEVAQLLWIPLFALVLYRSPTAAVFGISCERSMFWHGLFSLIAAGYAILHGVIALYFDDKRSRPGLDAFRGRKRRDYWSGSIAAGLMLFTMISSISPIRRAMPRLWLWSHHLLPLAAAVACLLHGSPKVLVAVGMYVADRLWGYLFQAHVLNRRAKSTATAAVTGDFDLIRITFPRTFSFAPGQHIGLSVPSVSWLEWHNFTIASAPSDTNLVVLAKPDGIWTRKLARKISELGGHDGLNVRIPLLVHGPMGSVSIDWTSVLRVNGGWSSTKLGQ